MSLTAFALRRGRLVLCIALALLLGGIYAFLGFPSQEEPSVTVRDALVSVALPGLPSDRVEELLAKPLEDRLRELPELKTLVTTLRPGQAIIQLTARDEIKDLPALWQRVRNKVAEVAPGLPEGTQGPRVDVIRSSGGGVHRRDRARLFTERTAPRRWKACAAPSMACPGSTVSPSMACGTSASS